MVMFYTSVNKEEIQYSFRCSQAPAIIFNTCESEHVRIYVGNITWHISLKQQRFCMDITCCIERITKAEPPNVPHQYCSDSFPV